MGSCRVCGKKSPLISSSLGVCASCIVHSYEDARDHILRAHRDARASIGLPALPPRAAGAATCDSCPNACQIEEGKVGFCGLRRCLEGAISSLLPAEHGLASHYRDPHPTNCVASWCCAGGSGAGYPSFSYAKGPEYGWENAAVFLGSCTYHCLFCQNHLSWRSMLIRRSPTIRAPELANWVLEDPRFSCLCWFGGCPSSQMEFVVSTSRLIFEGKDDRVVRICLETNGNILPRSLKKISSISLASGGGIKFDLKFHSRELNMAVCGADNSQVYRNFESLAELNSTRPDPPFLRASTLLLPGYVSSNEVGAIARFISELDPTIPYSLLAYKPEYLMSDLPGCSARYVEQCRQAAVSAGLERVSIGNSFLVS